MRVLYAGCNLFGQIVDSVQISFKEFHEFQVENLRNFAIGHSVLVLQKDDGVYLNGHGLEPQKTHVVTKLSTPASVKVENVATCDTRVFLLDQSGGLFVLDFLDRVVELQHKPSFVVRDEDVEDDKIVKFAAGVAIKVAVSRSGRVFNVPNQLEFRNGKIVQVCAGNEHCLILDGDGNVFSFGKGKRGQLGHCSLDDEENPKIIEALAGLNIIRISTGNWHSCALSDEGDLYVWGWNSDGQLGLFEEDEFSSNISIGNNGSGDGFGENTSSNEKKVPANVITLPSLLNIGNDVKITNVGCGSRHTVFITDKNIVYGCGCNRFNQLALNKEAAIYNATKIHQLDSRDKVKDIICGPTGTAILLR